MELVKKFASDRPFPLKDSGIHKTHCYNNQVGISFKMEDIAFSCRSSAILMYIYFNWAQDNIVAAMKIVVILNKTTYANNWP